jgi:hypothetical protein
LSKLIDCYKVCLKCSKISAPKITFCKGCFGTEFRELSEEERKRSGIVSFFGLKDPWNAADIHNIEETMGCNIFG